ncbi:accessory factor UbiK family protein [Parvibaculum sp.]|jgi:BMFP domain-containing protein YqiC|uniref:accessory factor UbiK family protein n=1 Tax=Parvibaculum sp. TaxID=2024848 RepID=UPI00329775FC
MTQTQNRIFDELGRLFTNAAGAAQGVRQEVETVLRGQAERLIADMDLVTREEFEAVRAMAQLAREENETLKARIEVLEAAVSKPAPKARKNAKKVDDSGEDPTAPGPEGDTSPLG